MNRTDPLYIIMAIGFAIILLLVLLHRLRSTLSDHVQHPPLPDRADDD